MFSVAGRFLLTSVLEECIIRTPDHWYTAKRFPQIHVYVISSFRLGQVSLYLNIIQTNLMLPSSEHVLLQGFALSGHKLIYLK
jgi:hypothetical protein